MTTKSIILIMLYYIISISYMLFLFRKYKLCPELLWCAGQFIMFFGISQLIDGQRTSDELLLLIYVVALVIFIISSCITRVVTKPCLVIEIENNQDLYKIRCSYVWLMMLVSIILCSIFFVRAGGNVFINGIRSMITGTDYSTKYSRMGMLSVSGVGYIYQFRVIVFPILVLYYTLIKKKTIITLALIVLMLAFLVGTGQRGGLFSFAAIVFFTIYYLSSKKENSLTENHNKRKSRFFIYIAVIGVAGLLFGLSTILNGRVSEGSTVFDAIMKRLLKDNQSCAVIGFRYITNQPIQYGKDWLMSMIDILPGQNGYISLETRIFAFINGGSTNGTAPPCIWGSAYYNFGIFGVIILSSLLGIMTTRLHARYSKMKNDEFSIIIYSAKQFLIAYWVASGPVVLFNNGFVAILLLNFILTNIAMKYRVVLKNTKRKFAKLL